MKVARLTLLIACILIFSNVYAQRPLAYEENLKIFKEAKKLYDKDIFGHAKDRFAALVDHQNEEESLLFNQLYKQAHFYIGMSKLKLKEDDAENYLLQFIETNKPDPLTHMAALELGNTRYNKKRYIQAIAFYDMVNLDMLDTKSQSELAFKRGYCHFVRKDFDQAKQNFLLSSNYQTEYYNPSNYYLGMVYFFDKEYTQAARQFEKVQRSKKYKNYIPSYLTQIYFEEKRYQDVIAFGERSLKSSTVKKENNIKNLIGKAYYELGEFDKALPYIEAYEKSGTKLTTEDAYQLGYLQYKNGQYANSVPHFKRVSSQKNATGQQANYYLAHALLKENKKEDARNAFSNVKRQTFNSQITEEALYNYGLLSAELFYDREAVNALLEIKKESTYYPQAQEALGKIFLRTKDYDRALEILDEVNPSTVTLKSAYQKVSLQKAIQEFNKNNLNTANQLIDKSLIHRMNKDLEASALFIKAEIEHKQKKYVQSNLTFNKYHAINAKELPAQQAPFMAHYTQGYNYIKINNYKEAGAHFTETVKNIRANKSSIRVNAIRGNVLSDALVRLADCEFKDNKYPDALAHYTDALKMKKTGFVYAYYQTGIIKGLQNDYLEKIVILEDLTKQYPASEFADDALIETSNSYLLLGSYDEAAAPLITLTKKYKNSDRITEAYLKLGLISFNKGDNQRAIQAYKEVLKHNPKSEEKTDAILALQEIYVKELNQPDEYIALLEDITGGKIDNIAKDSLNFKAAYNKYANAEYPLAQKSFNNYLNKFPTGLYHIEAHYFRGETFGLEEDFSNAYRDYKYVADQGPSKYFTKGLRKSALISYHQLNNFETAFQLFDKLAKEKIEDKIKLEAFVGAMRSAYRIGNEESTLAYGQLVQLNPLAAEEEKNTADYYLGKLYFDRSNYDQSLISLNRISKALTDERAAECRYLIAEIYNRRNELGIAEQMSRLAIKENVNYPFWVAKSLILLSDLMVKKNDLFNARAALEAVIENFTESEAIQATAKQKLKAIDVAEQQKANSSNGSDNLLQMEEQ